MAIPIYTVLLYCMIHCTYIIVQELMNLQVGIGFLLRRYTELTLSILMSSVLKSGKKGRETNNLEREYRDCI